MSGSNQKGTKEDRSRRDQSSCPSVRRILRYYPRFPYFLNFCEILSHPKSILYAVEPLLPSKFAVPVGTLPTTPLNAKLLILALRSAGESFPTPS